MVSLASFVELVQKSMLVGDAELQACVESCGSDVGKLGEGLVACGELTPFQLRQLKEGRWRNLLLGKYRILDRLGSGGMGAVFLAEHSLMRRRVALKVLPLAMAADQAIVARFYREAQALAALDHPNIVRAYDIDQCDELHFLVLELVEGLSLQQQVDEAGPLPPALAADRIMQAATGLQYAYQTAKLVHRDLKPANLMTDRTGTVKILDLGLAHFQHDGGEKPPPDSERVLGTPDYAAPEQLLHPEKVDIRGDIYSLGATLYFLLTGRPPFPEGSAIQKRIWHQTRRPKPLNSFRLDLPTELLELVEWMMSKDPANRPSRPAEIVKALAGLVTKEASDPEIRHQSISNGNTLMGFHEETPAGQAAPGPDDDESWDQIPLSNTRPPGSTL